MNIIMLRTNLNTIKQILSLEQENFVELIFVDLNFIIWTQCNLGELRFEHREPKLFNKPYHIRKQTLV